jgi:hypothetical protein
MLLENFSMHEEVKAWTSLVAGHTKTEQPF